MAVPTECPIREVCKEIDRMVVINTSHFFPYSHLELKEVESDFESRSLINLGACEFCLAKNGTDCLYSRESRRKFSGWLELAHAVIDSNYSDS